MRIEFETAVLLKEKGFKGLSREAYYNKIDNRYSDKPFDWNSHVSFDINSKYDRKTTSSFYAAPEQFDVQTWLREVHKIFIEINIDEDFKFWIDISYIYENKLVTITHPAELDNYEEALEIGLQEALELI